MSQNDLYHIVLPAIGCLGVLLAFFFMTQSKSKRMKQRISRVTNRKGGTVSAASKMSSELTLRRKTKEVTLPIIGVLLRQLPTQAVLKARLEKGGVAMSADMYIIVSVCLAGGVMLFALASGKHVPVSIMLGLTLGFGVPHMVVSSKGKRRVKKFLNLFPDAIDFIVRGLRSGLPVTESMNMVAGEMEEPVGPIFASIGEAVRLGVSLEKALQDTARKLNTTEFNFFVTSIILQRETGGNLSEILNNLSDVLRKRIMMRMKIKAMASEAKASASIVGSVPFIVILALIVVSPGYLDPLIDDHRGNIAAAAAVTSLLTGIGIMFKMSKFEI